MNFLQLCQRLRQEVGGTGSGPPTVLNQSGESRLYVDWINQAWKEIQSDRLEWRFMWAQDSVALPVGAQINALPSDLKTLDSDSLMLDGSRIDLLDYFVFRDNYRASYSSKPTVCTILPNGQLKTNTVPDQAYTLNFDYWAKPVSLSENTDIPSLPEEYHMLIVYKAMQYYAGYENAGEVYQDGVSRYQAMLPDVELTQLPAMTLPGAIA